MPAAPLPYARLALLWTLTGAACLTWVKVTSIGPVIAVVSRQRGWGVHTGDAWTLVGVAAAAALSTRWVTTRER